MVKREFRKAISLGRPAKGALAPNLFIQIPQAYAAHLGIQQDTNLRLDLQGGRIVVENADADLKAAIKETA